MKDYTELKVAEAIQDDVGKGIVRVDYSTLKTLGVRPGDIIEIEDKRNTISIVDKAYPGDMGMNIIRMDGLIRRNAKTSIGENVKVKKAQVKEASKITIAPAKKGIVIKASPAMFKQGFLGRPVLKGDLISLGGARRRRNTMSGSPFFDDIFRMMEEEGFSNGFAFGDIKFVVAETNPKGPVLITENTEITLNPEAIEIKEDVVPDVTYEDVGGLESELKKIREMIELPLKHPEVFERLGIEAPKGVLLHGPPGTGKTMLAKAVANESNSHFILINGPEIMSKFYGQSEENLRKKFEEAEKNAPAIIFIDEIDSLAPKREDSKGEVERRVVAQLLSLMDGLKSRGKVVVIAATNIPNSIDPALRRPGRFDRELEIGVPNQEGRKKILQIHTRNMPLRGVFYTTILSKELNEQIKKKIKEESDENKKKELEKLKKELEKKGFMYKLYKEIKAIEKSKEIWDSQDYKSEFLKLSKGKIDTKVQKIMEDLMDLKILNKELYKTIRDKGIEKDLEKLAEITYGFVGADLSALSKEAAMSVLRRILPDLHLEENEEIPQEVLNKLLIRRKDFKNALKIVRPSAMREVLVEVPNIKWNDVGGLEEVKQKLKEAVEWPLKNPNSFREMNIRPPKGVLLYGPPGTGKTMLAKAIANESKANFILVKGPELLSKWVGESEKAVREIFKKARQTSPTIIFFDEIDALAPRRGANSDSHSTERVVNQMLTEMDGLEEMNDVVIVAATNRPDIMDTALLRPGRFDRIILIPAPDKETRKQIFEVHTKGMPTAKINFDKLAGATEGYVGADIEAICREAAMHTLRRDINAKEIKAKDFDEALKEIRPTITKETEKVYEELENGFKAATAKQMREESPSYFG